MTTQSIEVDYDLPQSADKVWRVLTEAPLLSKWLMVTDIKPVVGHKFTFKAQPIPGHWDGRVDCEVLEVEPLKRIRYSWRGGQLDTTVTWTLMPGINGGTRLHLSHEGFTEQNRYAYENMSKGWRSHLAERITALLKEAA
ncbi:MAG: SRPBCC domain-containing protein [Myxococcaceae bacterium]